MHEARLDPVHDLRYESGSLIITSYQPFSQWDQLFDDNMMTIAAIDRIVHHSTLIDCQGDSFRKKHALNTGVEK